MADAGLKCPRCGSEDTSVSISIKLSGEGDSGGGVSVDRVTCKSCGFDLPLGGLSGTAAEQLLSAMRTQQAAAPSTSHTPTPPKLTGDFEPITVTGPGGPAPTQAAESDLAVTADLPAPGGDSDLLLEAASPEIYRRNAFRVTGLSVDASTRDLDRASEKLRMLEKFGASALRHAGPLPLDPPPGADQLREGVQRLHDPEGRLVDELFWFWPEELGRTSTDPVLAALGRGDLPEAERAWKERESGGTIASISTHNLAVLAHAGALDLELSGSDESGRAAERDGLWREALKRWHVVLREEAFWDRVEARVRELDDPRLTRGTVLRMRGTLPKALLLINAQLALRAAEAGDRADARRHVEYMNRSGFDASLVSDTLRAVLEPLLSRLRMLAKRAEEEGDADAEHADACAERLVEQARPLLAIVDCLLEPGNPARATIHDEVALHLLGCQITHGNKTGAWDRSIELLQPALDVVEGEAARTRIQQNLTIVRGNEDLRAVWGTCWFCKEEKPADAAAINVDMFGEVERTFTLGGTRITWRKGSIAVPRCLKCEESHFANFLWYLWFPLAFIMPYIMMPVVWIRFTPRFKKYPTPAMGSLLGFSLGMLVLVVGGLVVMGATSGREANAYNEAMAAKWAGQSGLAAVPGGGGVNPTQGLTQPARDLVDNLRMSPWNDEGWGDLGDAYRDGGNERAAEACWAVARLLDWEDAEWQGHSPNLALAGDIVLGLGVQDLNFMDQLAITGAARGDSDVAVRLRAAADALRSGTVGSPFPPPSVGGGIPGGVPGAVGGGIAGASLAGVEGSMLASNARSNPQDDELWGDLGDQYSMQGDPRMASGCWAIALLLDPTDSEWQDHDPSVGLVDDALLQVGVLDAWFAGHLANNAASEGYYETSDRLNELAAALAPKNSEWSWREPSRAMRTAVADARRRMGIPDETSAPPDTVARLADVRSNIYNDEAWGDLGDAYAALGDAAAAEACWAVAHLRDEYDDEWLEHPHDPASIVDFLLARGLLLEDSFVGELARTADYQGRSAASRELYDFAWALDPADPEWSDMNKGRQVPEAYASAIAAVRAGEERRQREEALEGYISSIRADPASAYNWGNAGNEALFVGDTTRARFLLSMANFIEPMGGYGNQLPGQLLDVEDAAEPIRALGITDDETVGRLANDLDARGQAGAAKSLYALALEMDPQDPEWRMKLEGPGSRGSLAWILPLVNMLLAAGLALYGARMGRERRRKMGLAEKPRKTKGQGWKMEFPPIKEKLAAGWQLGDKPPDAVNT